MIKLVIKLYFIALFSWLLVTPVFSAMPAERRPDLTVEVVLSSNAKEHLAVFEAMNEQLISSTEYKIKIVRRNSEDYISQHDKAKVAIDLVVTIGTVAAKVLASSNDDAPIISAFLPKDNYTSIWDGTNKVVSGIVIDQPVERFHELLKIMLDDGAKVGIFLGNRHLGYRKMRRLLRQSSLSLVVENVRGAVTAKNITRLLSASDAVLVLPDHKTLSPQRSKWLLYMAYRKNKPVIAYSSSFVRAGAIAAIYSTPESIGQQLGRRIIMLSEHSQALSEEVSSLDRLYYPKHFVVKTNNQVARHLGIELPKNKTLENNIKSNIRAQRKGMGRDNF